MSSQECITAPYPELYEYTQYSPIVFNIDYVLILFYHLSIDLPSCFFLSDFLTSTVCIRLSIFCHVFLDLIIFILYYSTINTVTKAWYVLQDFTRVVAP